MLFKKATSLIFIVLSFSSLNAVQAGLETQGTMGSGELVSALPLEDGPCAQAPNPDFTPPRRGTSRDELEGIIRDRILTAATAGEKALLIKQFLIDDLPTSKRTSPVGYTKFQEVSRALSTSEKRAIAERWIADGIPVFSRGERIPGKSLSPNYAYHLFDFLICLPETQWPEGFLQYPEIETRIKRKLAQKSWWQDLAFRPIALRYLIHYARTDFDRVSLEKPPSAIQDDLVQIALTKPRFRLAREIKITAASTDSPNLIFKFLVFDLPRFWDSNPKVAHEFLKDFLEGISPGTDPETGLRAIINLNNIDLILLLQALEMRDTQARILVQRVYFDEIIAGYLAASSSSPQLVQRIRALLPFIAEINHRAARNIELALRP